MLFSMFELERQIKIQEQIAKGLKISASVVKAYAKSFKEYLKNQVEEEKNHIAGSEKACKILQLSKISVQKEFMDELSKKNDELAAKNFLTVAGKINKQYFYERTCYGTAENERK